MLGIAFTFLLALPLYADDTPIDADTFSAKQSGNNIELMTPYGPRLLWGDDGFNSQTNYRLEIPLEDLKSKEQKAEEERLRREENKKRELAGLPPIHETKIIEREIIKEVDREKEKHSNTSTERAMQIQEQWEGAGGTPKKVKVEYDETDRFVLEANRLFNRGKFYESAMVVEELLRRRPDFVRGWVMKGSLMHVQGHKDRAKVAWETAVRLEPENQEVRKLLETYR